MKTVTGNGNEWIREEFHQIDFGDKRLKERFFETAGLLSSKASGSIYPSCHGSWSQAKGAYRFFSNERVSESALFRTHCVQTQKRLEGHSLVFSLQDTSELNVDSHKKTEGLGSISKAYHKHKMGLMLHASLMVTQEGLPLGLSSLKCGSRVSREETPQEKQRRLYQSTMKEKESIKWIETLYETAARIPKDTCLITLGDREADIFELFRVASSLKPFFIIRNRKDRKFIDEKGKKTTVQTALSKTPILKTIALTLPKNQQRVARTAYVDIRSISGWLPIRNSLVYGPTNKDASRHIHEKVHVSAISVKEQPPPEGVAPVEWVLLTNLTATDAFEAEEKVNGYRLRWKREEFFNTLKSGCCVEQCRLNTATKLTKMITLKSIIAFKLMYMTKMAALCPEATCTDVLSKVEWQTLYCRIQTTSRLPEHPPTVLQAITWLGQLGGFLNRRAEGLPGIMSLWRGYEILQETVRLFIILNNKNCG